MNNMITCDLRSADSNNIIATTRRAYKEKVKEMEKINWEKGAIEICLPVIVKEINNAAENGEFCRAFTLYEKGRKPEQEEEIITCEDWNKYSKFLVPIFTEVGYKITQYNYSRSWTDKSGKISEISFSWSR